jgi:MinD superfamily P-loop ATPase
MRQITIASGKGGTGKTTVSVNLAAFLSSRSHRVVLADADVEEPNSALFVKPVWQTAHEATKSVPAWDNAQCSLCGECASHCHFNAIIALPSEVLVFSKLCHSCFACSELCPKGALPMRATRIGEIRHGDALGVTFIEGRLDVGQEMATPLIAQTINQAREVTCDWLLVDAPPGTSCSFVETIKESDAVLLVTEPTPFGLHDLKAAVETVRALQKPFGVIVNRVGMGDEAVMRYCEQENIPVAATILHDVAIAKAYANGGLVFDKVAHFKASLEAIEAFMGGET